MSKIRLKGPKAGQNLGVLSATAGGDSDTTTIASFRLPAAVSGLPRVNSPQTAGDTLTLDTTGLTGITAYDWRIVGGATQGTSPTLDSTGLGQTQIECAVTCDQGTLISPPVLVYTPMMSAGMASDDARILALCPQHKATHIAVQNGDWTGADTWSGGAVPMAGARVLIPHGLTVTYDQSETGIRLDWIRVDGRLDLDTTISTDLCLDTLLVTRSGDMEFGTASNRLPSARTCTITISNRHYATEDRTAGDLDFSGDDGRLLGRGVVSQGTRTMWGADKTPWLKTRSLFTLNGALTTDNVTSVTFSETPPATTPASGSLQVIDDSGAYRTLAYSSFTGRTFTITTTDGNEDFATTGASDGNACHISFAPMAGDTSVTLSDTPANWQAGDEIVVGGVAVLTDETEVRTISAITGPVVSFAPALAYDHCNSNPAITRHDHQPGIGNLTRNIVIRSEGGADTPFYRRGHTMDMHGYAKADIWSVEHQFLGRTVRGDGGNPVGAFKSDTTLETITGNTIATGVPATERANLLSRYAIHAHHTGRGKAFVDTYQNCTVRGALGWGIAHHNCELRVNRNVVYDFRGAGIASENGSETGEWVGNFCLQTRLWTNGTIKNSSTHGGDIFADGHAFAFRSRAIRNTGNLAMACSSGYGFYHRGSDQALIPPVDLTRSALDLKDLSGAGNRDDEIPLAEYPIIHMSANEGIACYGYVFNVTKAQPSQAHGFSVNIQNMKGWNLRNGGMSVEYIAEYVLRNNDFCALETLADTVGIIAAPNAHRVSIIDNRLEGWDEGVRVSNSTPLDPFSADDYDTTVNPRFYVAGNNYINCGTNEVYDQTAFPTYNHARFEATAVPETVPDLNTGFVIGARDGTVSGVAFPFTLADSLGAGDFTYRLDGQGLPGNGVSGVTNLFGNKHGYWPVAAGTINGETVPAGNYMLIPLYYSDRAYGTPYKKYVALEIIGNTSGNWADNGTLTLSDDPPVISAADLNVAKNSKNNAIDILALIANDQGVTCTLSDSYRAPDHGRWSIDTGVITYTPDPDYVGTDQGLVWVEGGGHAVRVAVNVTVS